MATARPATDLRKCVRNAEALTRYAEFLFDRRRLGEARLTAEQALELAPDEPRVYAILGASTRDVANLECSSAALRGRTDLAFPLLRAEIARADVLAGAGQIAEAVRVLRELATRMPGRERQQLEQQAAALEKLP
jgi:tetratricopeptide (TPR) repeat protein